MSSEVTAADFADPAGAQNAKELLQSKSIVLDCFLEMQNKRPDSYWHTEADIEYVGGEEYTVGLIGSSSTAGGVTTVSGAAPPDNPDWFNGHPMFNGGDPVPRTLRFKFDDQGVWRFILDITGPPPPPGVTTLTAEAIPYPYDQSGNWPNGGVSPINYTIQRYRHAVPDNFLDALNVYYEGKGVEVGSVTPFDLRPVSPEMLIEHETRDFYRRAELAGLPSEYTIDHDDGVPYLRVWPIPKDDLRITMRYVRKQTVPSAAGDVFDMPEDEIPRLLNRAKHRANLEILGNFERASFYIRREDEATMDAATKQSERAEAMRLVPDQVESYRGHYGLGSSLDRYSARRSTRRLFSRD
jgi:hypothetical protein